MGRKRALCFNLTLCLSLSLITLISSCSTYEKFRYITEDFEVPSQVFKAGFTQSWKAVIEVMNKYELTVQNLESGEIKTRWMDNTQEVNFVDSFGTKDRVKSARFKLIVNVVKGRRGNREVSRISIYKRQMVEQDFLQGWRDVPSDGIQEKVILYRIGKLIEIDNELKKINDSSEQES